MSRWGFITGLFYSFNFYCRHEAVIDVKCGACHTVFLTSKSVCPAFVFPCIFFVCLSSYLFMFSFKTFFWACVLYRLHARKCACLYIYFPSLLSHMGHCTILAHSNNVVISLFFESEKGKTLSFGDNSEGQLGIRLDKKLEGQTQFNFAIRVHIPTDSKAMHIACGSYHTAVVTGQLSTHICKVYCAHCHTQPPPLETSSFSICWDSCVVRKAACGGGYAKHLSLLASGLDDDISDIQWTFRSY